MEDTLVSLKTAILAKEKGFKEDTNFVYSKFDTFGIGIEKGKYEIRNDVGKQSDISAPTQSSLQKWLREKHYLHIELQTVYKNSWLIMILYLNCMTKLGVYNKSVEVESELLNSYEEALEIGLKAALKLIKL